MNAQEYAEYEAAVAEFFSREGIHALNDGHLSCPVCGPETYDPKFEWVDDKCPQCGESAQGMNETFVTSNPCDCCRRPEGGQRVHATAFNDELQRIQEYTVCEDCVFYATHGRLDAKQMPEGEASRT